MTQQRIRPGDRVTILMPMGSYFDWSDRRVKISYREKTGIAVMRSAHGGWVLNLGGTYGTPALADETNIVRVRRPRVKGASAGR